MDRTTHPAPVGWCSGLEGDGSSLLGIEVDGANGGVVLQLSGEIDLSNVSDLASAITDHQRKLRVLDLRQVGFIDCSGMRLLIDATRRAQAHGKHLPIVPSRAVQRAASLLPDARRLEMMVAC